MSIPGEHLRQEVIDAEHLKLLAIFHYIVGGLEILLASFAIFYVVFGILFAVAPEVLERHREEGKGPPAFFGYMMAIFGGCAVLAGWIIGGLTIYSGRSIQLRQRRTFSFVIAALCCLWFPFGTVLGVFTILVLSRTSVRDLYERRG